MGCAEMGNDGRVGSAAHDSRPVDGAIRALIEASYGMFPDGLPDVVAEVAARHLGAREVRVLLVDLDQVELRPLGGSPGDGPVLVDDSPAGLAFREERTVLQRSERGRLLWVPILDSAERLGVLAAVDDGETPVHDWMLLTGLLGELVTSKAAYGDAVVQARRTGELTLGAEMRWSVLPPLTFTSPQVTIAGILQPSHLVSGDAFDYAAARQNAAIALFDAMGHGLEASRIANLAVGGFRHGRRRGRTPPESLREIDAVIAAQIGDSRFATAQIATLDLETGRASVFTAGHPPPIVLRMAGPAEELAVRPALPLGLGPAAYVEATVQLEPGDAIVLHSDGMTEARSPDRQQYGVQRLRARLRDLLAAGTRPAEVLRLVMHEVLRFQEGDVRDDAALVLMRWLPAAAGLPGRPNMQEAIDLGNA